MPRGGGGTFQNVPGTTVSPNTTIQSAWANAFSGDVEVTFNTAWPTSLGGTGGTSPVSSSDALSTKGSNIASAGTTDLSTATGRFVHITGTSTITSFGTSSAGATRYLVFDGALTLTHNATSLILPGGSNILTAAGDAATAISEGSGNWRIVDYQRSSVSPIAIVQPGMIYGLTLSNNVTDAVNDIDISTGSASNSTNVDILVLSSVLTKRLDASWSVGSGNGGLDTGSIADTTYHVFLIKRPDTGVVDALFSTSPTAPTLPANYTLFRRIGSIIRLTATILPFVQQGDIFLFAGGTSPVSISPVGTTASLKSVRSPLGIKTDVILSGYFLHATGSATIITSPDMADVIPSVTGPFTVAANGTQYGSFNITLRTNTSSQLRFRSTVNPLDTSAIWTLGYIDQRGRT